MSGICGIYNLDGRPADPDSLLRMTNALAHRGPDGIGRTILGSVGIGQLILQTGRESVGDRHPATNEHRKICLTFDGRLDNATALKEELERNGIPIRGDSDAEIVLASYQCWGENCPIHLLGDFAFALWDGQIRRLFCARDYVGVRPFYYYPGPSLFAFASEIRALLALETVPRRLNESRLVDFLVESLDREDKEATFYRDILRLPAGHSLTVSAHGLVIKNYWNLKAPATLRLRSLQEYGDAFREVFVEAVRCRLRSNHPVASTLSGGIDSSSVVCTARELLANESHEPLHTISLVDADQKQCGETPHIREVLEGGRLVPHILRSDQLDGLEGAMAEADEPFEIGRYFLNRFLFSTCRSAGARVLLDGISGDHIIPPYHYLGILIKSLAWKMLYSELSYNAKVFNESRWTNFLVRGLGPLLPMPGRRARRFVQKLRGMQVLHGSFVSEPFAARMSVTERFENRSRMIWRLSQNLGEMHAWGFTSAILAFFFEHTGRQAAAMQIETRHPFCDRRVIEFFLSLPLKMKTYSPLPKRVIREGMRGILPERIRERTHFSHPGAAFLSSILGDCVALLERGRFLRALEPIANYVNVESLNAGREAVLGGNMENGYALWQVVCLSVWISQQNFTQ